MVNFFSDLSRDTIIGVIIGVVGIILAFVFYIKGKKNKKPLYDIKSFNIISEELGNKVKDIEITFKSEKIKDLTISKVIIWNSGNEVIDRGDIPDTTKFIIGIDNKEKIYDLEIIENSDRANNLTIPKVGENYFIDFDFLDPNQGFVIKITHSGKNSDDILIDGRVKGGFSLERMIDFNNSSPSINSFMLKEMPILGPLFNRAGMKYTFIIFGIALISISDFLGEKIWSKFVIGIFGFIYLCSGIYLVFKKSIPKKLGKTFNES